MRVAFTLASLASVAALVVAQSGYGRFPCTIVNGDDTFSPGRPGGGSLIVLDSKLTWTSILLFPDQSQCASNALIPPGDGVGDTGFQGDNPNPVSPLCVMEPVSGAYFCGLVNATCSDATNCDNGVCDNGPCDNTDSNCLGFLYCSAPDFNTTISDTCGGEGAFCQDPTQGSSVLSTAENYAIFNQFCSTNYCNTQTGACDVHVRVIGGGRAPFSVVFRKNMCSTTIEGQALTCDATSLTCQPVILPSSRARSRRNEAFFKRSVCPASHTACPIEGKNGFECIDTQSNIEQCGACQSQGGVDCTALPGVESVGCVSGVCEIWSCQEGHSWSQEAAACQPVVEDS
ncbi:SPOSA6832_03966, partial [Sporobolomyces salmonicolor]